MTVSGCLSLVHTHHRRVLRHFCTTLSHTNHPRSTTDLVTISGAINISRAITTVRTKCHRFTRGHPRRLIHGLANLTRRPRLPRIHFSVVNGLRAGGVGTILNSTRLVRSINSLRLTRTVSDHTIHGVRTNRLTNPRHILVRIGIDNRRSGKNFSPSRVHTTTNRLTRLRKVYIRKLVAVTPQKGGSITHHAFTKLHRLESRLRTTRPSLGLPRLSYNVDRSFRPTLRRNSALIHLNEMMFDPRFTMGWNSRIHASCQNTYAGPQRSAAVNFLSRVGGGVRLNNRRNCSRNCNRSSSCNCSSNCSSDCRNGNCDNTSNRNFCARSRPDGNLLNRAHHNRTRSITICAHSNRLINSSSHRTAACGPPSHSRSDITDNCHPNTCSAPSDCTRGAHTHTTTTPTPTPDSTSTCTDGVVGTAPRLPTCILHPRDCSSIRAIIHHIHAGRPITLVFINMHARITGHILSFSCNFTYNLNTAIGRINSHIFVILPTNYRIGSSSLGGLHTSNCLGWERSRRVPVGVCAVIRLIGALFGFCSALVIICYFVA